MNQANNDSDFSVNGVKQLMDQFIILAPVWEEKCKMVALNKNYMYFVNLRKNHTGPGITPELAYYIEC